MISRPKILVVIEYYLPGHRAGGTIRSLANLVEVLGDEFEFLILTGDRDWRSDEPYGTVAVGEWTSVGKALVRYLEPGDWSLRRLREIVRRTEHDLLYLSSCFSTRATIRPLFLRWLHVIPRKPVLLGPRGELSEGAIGIHRRRKRIYLAAAKISGLFRGLYWQASTSLERLDIEREVGQTASVFEAVDCSPSYVGWAGDGPRPDKRPRHARICFIARVSPKKNLGFALELLRSIGGSVELDIFGPIDSQSYWEECERKIMSLPANIKVTYHGPRLHQEIASILPGYDLYLFPTLGENFGHSIVEALAAGCPVIISDATPWRRLVELGVGWDLPLSKPEAFVEAIESIVEMDETDHRSMRVSARRFALRIADQASAVAQNRAMFRRLIGRDCE